MARELCYVRQQHMRDPRMTQGLCTRFLPRSLQRRTYRLFYVYYPCKHKLTSAV